MSSLCCFTYLPYCTSCSSKWQVSGGLA